MPLFVKPVRGATIPMPNYRGLPEVPLPQKGTYVPEEGYWFRRLREKVVEHITAKPTKKNKNGFYVHQKGHWWFRRAHDGKTPSMESPNETGKVLQEKGYWFRQLNPLDVRVALTDSSSFNQNEEVVLLLREGYFFESLKKGEPPLPASNQEEVTYLHEDQVWYRRLHKKEEEEKEKEKEEEEEEEEEKEEEEEEEEEEEKGDEAQAPSSTASQTAHTDTSLENNT